MAKEVAGTVLFFFLLAILIVPNAWGEEGRVTILYSNNINGQIYASG